ncbi:MAG: hypothetical protein M3N82_12235 [Pseudomonadota bacterium]|nr:hypothetical protein [Pseudomonadota bacterium]
MIDAREHAELTSSSRRDAIIVQTSLRGPMPAILPSESGMPPPCGILRPRFPAARR